MSTSTNGQQPNTSSEQIRILNDALRTTLTGGQVMVTAGVAALGADMQARVIAAVQAFDAFTGDNDPWGEHDMAALEVDGTRIFFKIDYLDPTLTLASADPVDPALTHRVLTIMLAEEY